MWKPCRTPWKDSVLTERPGDYNLFTVVICVFRLLHGLACDRGVHIVLRRPAVRAHLPRLVDDLLEFLLREALDLDGHLHSQSHIKILHAANKMYLGLDNGVLGSCRHLHVDGGSDGVHSGLEACTCLVLDQTNDKSK